MTSIDDVSARADFAGIQALSSRSPGYAVAQKCLEVQAQAEQNDQSLKSAAGTRLATEAWSWYTGAVGEIEVGRLLSALGPEWFVRHSVPIGAGTKDVDHLVIGPAGVFAINTKNHTGASVWVGDYAMKVNAATRFYVNRAQGDGIEVSRRIESKVGFPVAVTSVVAILNHRSLRDARTPDNRRVRVLDALSLIAWLTAQPRVLETSALQLIERVAEQPETWHIDPHAADTLRVMSRFERLQAEVGTPPAPVSSQTGPRPKQNRKVASRRGSGASRSSGTRRASHGRRPQSGSLSDLLKLWFATGIIIVAILLLRGYADQPCASAIECAGPVLYLAIKPLLVLIGVATIAAGFVGTIVMLSRIARR